MKSDRPSSVCSDGRSSPESMANSPQVPDYEDYSPAYSPEANAPSPQFEYPPSPAYSENSYDSYEFSKHSTVDYEHQEEFIQAVEEGDPKEIGKILTKYSQLVQINGFTKDGQTALTHSCLSGNLELVKLLVSHGASIHHTNRDGFSPVHCAFFRGKRDVIQYLLTGHSSRR